MRLLITMLIICFYSILAQNKEEAGSNKQTAGKSDTSNVWIAPKSADKLKNPLAGIIEATHQGEDLFVQNCSTCHGTSGKGDGPTADMLDTKPANLKSAVTQKQSDGSLFWKIGKGKGAMASYKEVFSEEQRWQLVNYIRKLGGDNVNQKK